MTRTGSLDRFRAAAATQLAEDKAAEWLARLRERGYFTVRGRGRSAVYSLRRDLADRLRGRSTVDAELSLDNESVKARVLTLLRERGKLTNSDVRRFSGYSRIQVYRLLSDLKEEGQIAFAGKGRGAHVIPAKRTAPTSKK